MFASRRRPPGGAAARAGGPELGKNAAMAPDRTFEVRTYRSAPGRLDALSSRFRDHTLGIFARHGVSVTAFFQARDENDPTTGTLVYICDFPSREAADAAWASFREDPEWTKVRAESEERAGGPLTTSVESLFVEPTDYSPIR